MIMLIILAVLVIAVIAWLVIEHRKPVTAVDVQLSAADVRQSRPRVAA